MGREHYIGLSKKRRRWHRLHSVIEHEAARETGVLAPCLTERERRALQPTPYKLSCDLDADTRHLRNSKTLLSAAHKLWAVVESPDRPVLNRKHWFGREPEVLSPEDEQKLLYSHLKDDLQTIIEMCEKAERQGQAAYWIVSD